MNLSIAHQGWALLLSLAMGTVGFWIAGQCRRVRSAVRQVDFMNRKGRALKR